MGVGGRRSRLRAVSSAGVEIGPAANSAPDDHLTAGPDCRVTVSSSGRVVGAGGCPGICAGIVSPAAVQIARDRRSAPYDHFTACPNFGVHLSGIGALVVLVAVQLSVPGSYPPPVFNSLPLLSAPDNHLTASPNCRVIVRTAGALVVLVLSRYQCRDCISRQCSDRSGVSPAPDNHFAAGPNCRVGLSPNGRVSSAGGCPAVSARIVSSARV